MFVDWIQLAPFKKMGGRPRVYEELVRVVVSPRDASRCSRSMHISFRPEVMKYWGRVDVFYGGDRLIKIVSGDTLDVSTDREGWRVIDGLDVSRWFSDYGRQIWFKGDFVSLADDEMILKLSPQPTKSRPRKKKKK